MKFRTDFVTNSSSSCFIITYTFKLKGNKNISLEVAEDMDGWIEPAYTSLQGSVSPKRLAKCKSIDEMIERLRKKSDWSKVFGRGW